MLKALNPHPSSAKVEPANPYLLPLELWELIFLHLPNDDRVAAAGVCQAFNNRCSFNHLPSEGVQLFRMEDGVLDAHPIMPSAILRSPYTPPIVHLTCSLLSIDHLVRDLRILAEIVRTPTLRTVDFRFPEVFFDDATKTMSCTPAELGTWQFHDGPLNRNRIFTSSSGKPRKRFALSSMRGLRMRSLTSVVESLRIYPTAVVPSTHGGRNHETFKLTLQNLVSFAGNRNIELNFHMEDNILNGPRATPRDKDIAP
ncbi:hypothetical protein B0H16DRAFT_1468882 [Mycena metata]|uniref:F-box domain-containing protein n=1 Tax=Mycena metata TaxID=1033252 RepID=A0AAD7MV19_9AGAR|nr:hypothetical protein B0H16DRAFT_1468882 [Mycena metata]